MNCEICGVAEVIHFIDCTDENAKVEHWYCKDHIPTVPIPTPEALDAAVDKVLADLRAMQSALKKHGTLPEGMDFLTASEFEAVLEKRIKFLEENRRFE
jgi:hypothetical protein